MRAGGASGTDLGSDRGRGGGRGGDSSSDRGRGGARGSDWARGGDRTGGKGDAAVSGIVLDGGRGGDRTGGKGRGGGGRGGDRSGGRGQAGDRGGDGRRHHEGREERGRYNYNEGRYRHESREPDREPEAAHDPTTFRLNPYAEINDSMPEVPDHRRWAVRDATARSVLLQLGAKEEDLDVEDFQKDAAKAFQKDAYNVLNKITQTTHGWDYSNLGLHRQMEAARLFVYQDAVVTSEVRQAATQATPAGPTTPTTPVTAEAAKIDDKPSKYLLSKFDCMAVPVRAEYDAAWEALPAREGVPAAAGASSSDCDGPNGFDGWFWVLHECAPNIGESSQADEFWEYSKQAPIVEELDETQEARTSGSVDASSGGLPTDASSEQPQMQRGGSNISLASQADSPGKKGLILDEELYVETMSHLWYICLMAMAQLGVTDGILFPFGMGAFLRHLGKMDSQYLNMAKMRQLRRKVADALMKAIACVYGNILKAGLQEEVDMKALPRRLHLCLTFHNAESSENHNVFIEAAGEAVKEHPGLTDVLLIRRNVDSLQLAHYLSLDRGPLKVAVFNGANRRLLGNHWYTKGARNAIDENLHRRSSTMTRASLLLNMGTDSVDRRPGELASTLTWLGGKVVTVRNMLTPRLPPPAPSPTIPVKPAGGPFGCCKKRAQPPAQASISKTAKDDPKTKAESKAKGKAKPGEKANGKAKSEQAKPATKAGAPAKSATSPYEPQVKV